MNTNQQTLFAYLNKLKQSSVFSDIIIETLGIRLHLLKDNNEKIYCLVVPDKPLNYSSVKKFEELGFQEKFKKINFIRFFSLHNLDEVVEIIEKVLSDILRVPENRQWRFDLTRGMALLKSNNPEMPNSLRRKMIKERNNKPLNIFKRKYGINLVISLIISIIIVLNCKEYIKSKQELIGLIILLTLGLTLLMKIIDTLDNWIKKRKYNR